MSRAPAVPPEEKTRLVLSILAGELSVADAARRAKVSERSVSNWKREFIESGRQGVAEGGGVSALVEDLEVIRTDAGMPISGPFSWSQRGAAARSFRSRWRRYSTPRGRARGRAVDHPSGYHLTVADAGVYFTN